MLSFLIPIPVDIAASLISPTQTIGQLGIQIKSNAVILHTSSIYLSIKSGPVIPSGNPGKFSTSVVVINCPPGPDWYPSNTSGFKFARAAYIAAVNPAGPDPIITTFSIAFSVHETNKLPSLLNHQFVHNYN